MEQVLQDDREKTRYTRPVIYKRSPLIFHPLSFLFLHSSGTVTRVSHFRPFFPCIICNFVLFLYIKNKFPCMCKHVFGTWPSVFKSKCFSHSIPFFFFKNVTVDTSEEEEKILTNQWIRGSQFHLFYTTGWTIITGFVHVKCIPKFWWYIFFCESFQTNFQHAFTIWYSLWP